MTHRTTISDKLFMLTEKGLITKSIVYHGKDKRRGLIVTVLDIDKFASNSEELPEVPAANQPFTDCSLAAHQPLTSCSLAANRLLTNPPFRLHKNLESINQESIDIDIDRNPSSVPWIDRYDEVDIERKRENPYIGRITEVDMKTNVVYLKIIDIFSGVQITKCYKTNHKDSIYYLRTQIGCILGLDYKLKYADTIFKDLKREVECNQSFLVRYSVQESNSDKGKNIGPLSVGEKKTILEFFKIEKEREEDETIMISQEQEKKEELLKEFCQTTHIDTMSLLFDDSDCLMETKIVAKDNSLSEEEKKVKLRILAEKYNAEKYNSETS